MANEEDVRRFREIMDGFAIELKKDALRRKQKEEQKKS
jgi:hypothetical protein